MVELRKNTVPVLDQGMTDQTLYSISPTTGLTSTSSVMIQQAARVAKLLHTQTHNEGFLHNYETKYNISRT